MFILASTISYNNFNEETIVYKYDNNKTIVSGTNIYVDSWQQVVLKINGSSRCFTSGNHTIETKNSSFLAPIQRAINGGYDRDVIDIYFVNTAPMNIQYPISPFRYKNRHLEQNAYMALDVSIRFRITDSVKFINSLGNIGSEFTTDDLCKQHLKSLENIIRDCIGEYIREKGLDICDFDTSCRKFGERIKETLNRDQNLNDAGITIEDVTVNCDPSDDKVLDKIKQKNDRNRTEAYGEMDVYNITKEKVMEDREYELSKMGQYQCNIPCLFNIANRGCTREGYCQNKYMHVNNSDDHPCDEHSGDDVLSADIHKEKEEIEREDLYTVPIKNVLLYYNRKLEVGRLETKKIKVFTVGGHKEDDIWNVPITINGIPNCLFKVELKNNGSGIITKMARTEIYLNGELLGNRRELTAGSCVQTVCNEIPISLFFTENTLSNKKKNVKVNDEWTFHSVCSTFCKLEPYRDGEYEFSINGIPHNVYKKEVTVGCIIHSSYGIGIITDKNTMLYIRFER